MSSPFKSTPIIRALPSRDQRIEDIYAPQENTLEILIKEAKTIEDRPGYKVTYYYISCNTTIPSFKKRSSFVRRRYSDFEDFRARLEKLDLRGDIPTLPGKYRNPLVSQYIDDAIDARKAGLQDFLERVANHPLLQWSSSQLVQRFLQDEVWDRDRTD